MATTYDELHHYDGGAWAPIGPASPSASQMLSQTTPDPVQSSQPLRPIGQPPPSNRDAIVRMANAPAGTFNAHADSVHKAAAMKQEGGFHKIHYPTVSETEIGELGQNMRTNAAMVGAKAAQNGSISGSDAVDLFRNAGAIDDSTAQAAKKSLAPVPKKGR